MKREKQKTGNPSSQNQSAKSGRIPFDPITKMSNQPDVRMDTGTSEILETFSTNKNVESNWKAIGFSKS